MLKWPIIKNNRVQPSSGSYSDWKDEIAADCSKQCIYCAMNDTHFGGTRNFHVEHFKPKSKFKSLVKIITNLYYSCCICNTFKNDDWFNSGNIQYIDPNSNYNKYFVIDNSDCTVTGVDPSSKYMIEKIHLNRVQMITYRKEIKLLNENKELIDEARKIIQKLSSLTPTPENVLNKDLTLLAQKLIEVQQLRTCIYESPLYSSTDIQR